MNRFLLFLSVPVLLALGACSSEGPTAAKASGDIAPPPAELASIFDRSCRACHNAGAGGAPRTGNRAEWDPRVFQGVDTLLDHTIEGYKGMPPMGMCMDCDEDQFLALIEYMAAQPLE